MPMPRFFLMLVTSLLFLQLLVGSAWCLETKASHSLEELVAEALANNPGIEASESQWQMVTQKARQAGTLEDPMLMFGINNALLRDPLNFEREAMTSKVLGVSQKVPFFGKRALARQVAEKESLSAQARYEERKLELISLVKETYAQIFFVDRAMQIVERNLQILDEVSRITETRYGLGKAKQQEVFRAQLERTRMLEAQIGLRQQRRSLEAAMNGLLSRPADTSLVPVTSLEAPRVPLSASELQRLAFASRPALAGLSAQMEKGRFQKQLAEKEFYPDFTFSVEYMQREEAMGAEGYDMYSASVSFNLPLQRQRRHAMTAEAQAALRQAQAEIDVLQDRIAAGIGDLLASLERGLHWIELYRTVLIPQSTRGFESAQIAYGNNQTDFESMLTSLLNRFNDERRYYEVVAQYRMDMARLEALVGRSLVEGAGSSSLPGPGSVTQPADDAH